MTTQSEPRFIGIREAARRLGVHENTIRNYCDRGWLTPARLPSGVRRIDSVELANLLPPRAATGVQGQVVEGGVLP